MAKTRETLDCGRLITPRTVSETMTTDRATQELVHPLTPSAVSGVMTTARETIPTCQAPPGATWNSLA